MEGPVPEPTTVWLVPLAHGVAPVEREGTLTLGETALRFDGDGDDQVTVPFAAVTKVRRHRVSPILQVAWADGASSGRVALYFAPPPPLQPIVKSMPTTVREANAPKPSKRRQRRKNTVYLSTAAGELKPDIAAWERALKDAVRAARGR